MKAVIIILLIGVVSIATLTALKTNKLTKESKQENKIQLQKENNSQNKSVTLSLKTIESKFVEGETETIELWATFTNGSEAEKLVYFKGTILFPNDYFELVETVDVSPSQLNRTIKSSSPEQANNEGKIVFIIGAIQTTDERPSTDKPMKIASFKFKAIKKSPTPIIFSIDENNSEVVNSDYPDPLGIPINEAEKLTVSF